MRELTFEEMEEVAGGNPVVWGIIIGIAGLALTVYGIYQSHQDAQNAAEQLRQSGGSITLPDGTTINIPDGQCISIHEGDITTFPCGCGD